MLPKQSLNQRRVIAYLSKTRCLPVDVIIEQIRSRRLNHYNRRGPLLIQ